MAAISSSACLRSDEDASHSPHDSQKVSFLGIFFAPSKMRFVSNIGIRGIKSRQAMSES
jgi:hypothetical protein